MAGNFDPYWEWFRIPLNEQPPNHYRLLRLTPFESNPQVIETAVNQLVERMHKLSQGNQVAHAQKILNDVAKANICLSDPKKKQEYDTRLKSLQSQISADTPNNQAKPVPTKQSPTKQSSVTGDAKLSSPKKNNNAANNKQGNGLIMEEQKRVKLMAILASLMALAGAAFGILLVWLFQFDNSDSSTPREQSEITQVSQQGSDTNQKPREGKSEFSEVANSVARKMALETGVAEKNEKSETEVVSKQNDKPGPTSTNASSDELSSLKTPIESSPTVDTPAPTPAPTVPETRTPDRSVPVPESEGLKKVGSKGDAYAPDKQPLFDSLLNNEVYLEGTVFEVESSKSGKTNYLTFSRSRSEMIFVMASASEVALDKLQPFKGRQVRVKGVVEKEYQRTGLRIKSIDQIQILTQ